MHIRSLLRGNSRFDSCGVGVASQCCLAPLAWTAQSSCDNEIWMLTKDRVG
jgi:hypothetical protein